MKIYMLSVVFSVFATDVLRVNPVNQPFAFEQLDGAFAVAAVPKAVVPFGSVRGLIVDKKHILLLAGDVRYHAMLPGPLIDMPDYLSIGLSAFELCPAESPEL